jgi:hypothetical protein
MTCQPATIIAGFQTEYVCYGTKFILKIKYEVEINNTYSLKYNNNKII